MISSASSKNFGRHVKHKKCKVYLWQGDGNDLTASGNVHVELGPLLVGLLDDRVPDLAVDTLVLVYRVDFDDRGPVGGAFFNLGRVGGAVLEKSQANCSYDVCLSQMQIYPNLTEEL